MTLEKLDLLHDEFPESFVIAYVTKDQVEQLRSTLTSQQWYDIQVAVSQASLGDTRLCAGWGETDVGMYRNIILRMRATPILTVALDKETK